MGQLKVSNLDELLRAEVISHNPQETQDIGRTLGACANPGDVVLLVGELGAGKTCLTQGILWGLGSDEYARSPTFVLVAQYQGRLTLYHIDLYRLDTFEEIEGLELDEILFGDGLCVVEWADKAQEIFPQQHLEVLIDYLDETTRRITLAAKDKRYAQAINGVRSAAKEG